MSEKRENTPVLTKPEIAERQLRGAIMILSAGGDPVCVQTLAAAGAEIVSDLLKAQDLPSPLVRMDLVREDRRAEVQRKLREPQNFFKHADRDPDAALEFNGNLPPLLILMALQEYQVLTGSLFPAAGAFLTWFFVNNPEHTKGELRSVIEACCSELQTPLSLDTLAEMIRVHEGQGLNPPQAPSGDARRRMGVLLANVASCFVQPEGSD